MKCLLLVLAGLIGVGLSANLFAQRPQPKQPVTKQAVTKEATKSKQTKTNPPKGPTPKSTPITVQPMNPVPGPLVNPTPLLTPPQPIKVIGSYLGGNFNPALVSPMNPFSPVNNPWNFINPLNPWNAPLNPWSSPWTPWTTVNPWVNPLGPAINPFANPLLNPWNNPWNNPWSSSRFPWNPINNIGPWNMNPAPLFQFPNNGPFAPLGPNFGAPVVGVGQPGFAQPALAR